MQIFAIVVSLAIAAVGIALFVKAVREILGVIRLGQPAGRTDHPGARTATMLKETLGHTRMLQWTLVGAAHWFVFVGFGLLFFTLVTAFGQLFDAHFALPLIGHFFLFEWITEFFTAVMVLAILGFIGYRLTRPRERTPGVKGRFFGSTMWQGYFVELVILGVGLCIAVLRGLEYALLSATGDADQATALHFPVFGWLGEAFSGLSVGTVETLIYLIAMLKIVISFTWMITISLNLTMGVAWHRFSAFFNIWFRREADGRNALGEIKPLTSDGKPVTLDDIEELDEDSTLGVGSIEDFSWKGLLDFTTCTECGRCQSQCPAWNTDKPLSPKLFVLGLRDHAYAKAPYLQAGSEEERAELGAVALKEAERPLVGDTGDDWFYMPENGSAVIDDDVLWSCTSCGACVQQCPVDIEHVDHIMDMRRYQVLVEANFPAELNQLFKGLENKGNPWNMSATARMDWAKDLPFEVKVVGGKDAAGIESLDEVDWLFWVGCAGAYEDRAKKTTRAVAELLDIAGVSFGVLGNGETCTGDPARRAGNEFVFQGLAQQNAETFKEYKVKKVVSTCAHCFNTLKNEYKDFGVELEVVHHTQLLNRLVREGKLTPVPDGEGAHKRSITYHDPCYIGRHNGVYTPPRELLQVLPGADYVEMERNSERSFCCGAGGARMWMEENIGERINVNRTREAVGTGADQIAVGCPFCRVMLSDGLTAEQANGNAREEVEILDVAQMLLASVKGEVATRAKPGAAAAKQAAGVGASAKAGAGTTAAAAGAAGDVATKDEPEAGDVTVTEDTVTDTADAGPAAKASGGSSLFDTPAESETASEDASVAEEATAAKPESSGGSLFDLGSDDTAVDSGGATGEGAEDSAEERDLGSGGSLFDLGGDTDEAPATTPATTAETTAETDAAAAEPAQADGSSEPERSAEARAASKSEPAQSASEESVDLDAGGSLFDIPADEPAAPAAQPAADSSASASAPAPPASEQPAADAPASTPAAAPPAGEIPEGGSLFDIEAPEAAPTGPAPAQPAPAAPAPAAPGKPTGEPTAQELRTQEPTVDDATAPEAPDEAAVVTEEAAAEESAAAPAGPPVEASAEEAAAAPAPSAPPRSASATPTTEIPEEGSLFDIEAPAPAAPAAPAAPTESTSAAAAPTRPEQSTAEEPAEAQTEEQTDEPVEAQAVDGEAQQTEPTPGTPEEPAPSPEPAPDSTEQGPDEETEQAREEEADNAGEDSTSSKAPTTKSQSSGEAHTPRSDADIDQAGSLFDL